jgi:hypothetical protein
MVVSIMNNDIIIPYIFTRLDMAIHNEYGLFGRVVENQILAPT